MGRHASDLGVIFDKHVGAEFEAMDVDEMVIAFTHDIARDALLPKVAPTGRRVEIALVVVMGFDGDKVAYERIYWDQASLLAQVGLLDEATLPITGVIQARKVLDDAVPANHLLSRY
jgi:carboxymethylenebutenolidase